MYDLICFLHQHVIIIITIIISTTVDIFPFQTNCELGIEEDSL